MAVLSHEGTYPVLYGSMPLPVGAAHRDGYLARPDEAGRFPAVIVAPGLSPMGSFEKDVCRRLARQGVAAITVDWRRSGAEPLTAYSRLTDERAAAELDELHELIVSDDTAWNVADEVGIFGADVGGRFAVMKAATRRWVRSLAIAYTPLTGDEDRRFQVADHLSRLPVPVLALYGMDDDLIDTCSVDEAQRRNKHGQWLLYEGAGHGFLDMQSDGFDQSAADDAFARVVAFFKATLQPAIVEDLG